MLHEDHFQKSDCCINMCVTRVKGAQRMPGRLPHIEDVCCLRGNPLRCVSIFLILIQEQYCRQHVCATLVRAHVCATCWHVRRGAGSVLKRGGHRSLNRLMLSVASTRTLCFGCWQKSQDDRRLLAFSLHYSMYIIKVVCRKARHFLLGGSCYLFLFYI